MEKLKPLPSPGRSKTAMAPYSVQGRILLEQRRALLIQKLPAIPRIAKTSSTRIYQNDIINEKELCLDRELLIVLLSPVWRYWKSSLADGREAIQPESGMVEKYIATAAMVKERVEASIAEIVSKNGSGCSNHQLRQLLATNGCPGASSTPISRRGLKSRENGSKELGAENGQWKQQFLCNLTNYKTYEVLERSPVMAVAMPGRSKKLDAPNSKSHKRNRFVKKCYQLNLSTISSIAASSSSSTCKRGHS